MLQQLKNLIFGLEDYNKTKLEIRFKLVENFLENLKINSLEDFEIIEDTTSKIKDQLRIRSSNLNKIINNPKKSLRKKDVEKIIIKLAEIKQNFLKSAFNMILNKDYINNTIDELEKIDLKDLSQTKISNTQENVKIQNIDSTNYLLFEDNNYQVNLENSRVPYILINFKNLVDLKIIRKISSIFFDIFSPHGTNIIIEKTRVLIIPRMINDNLFHLPEISDINLDEVFFKLIKKNKQTISNQDNFNEKKIQYNNSDDYLNINEKKNIIKSTSKKDDLKLDDILSDVIINNKHKKEDKTEINDEKIQILQGDKIEIEKGLINNGIEIIKDENISNQNNSNVNNDSKILNKQNNNSPISNKLNFETQISSDIKENIAEEIKEKSTSKIKLKNYQIYNDEKILVYLQKDSASFGEIIIELILAEKISELNESDLSYMILFSKVFSSILFEEAKAAGTNIIYDYNSSKIRIIARLKDDNLDLDWDPQKVNDATFDEIQNKLISLMQNEINSNSSSEKKENVEKVEGEVMPQIENKSDSKEDKLKEKAHYILEHLKRIP